MAARAVEPESAPVAGLDEAGRGPLAGPVHAAAVMIPPEAVTEWPWSAVADSKTLSARRRATLAEAIKAAGVWAVASASVAEIDALNILQASFLAMRRALARLATPPARALIDGNRVPPELPCPGEAVVGGDRRIAAIAAAGILAKVSRDTVMAELDAAYPGYGLAKNAGYATAAHRAALARLGPSPAHRRSFRIQPSLPLDMNDGA